MVIASQCYTVWIMIDEELKGHLKTIEKELVEIRKGTNGMYPSFMKGVYYGMGYIVGAVLVILLISWILNIVGIIPALATQVNEFRDALNRIGGPVAK